jgi:hypothetical protein
VHDASPESGHSAALGNLGHNLTLAGGLVPRRLLQARWAEVGLQLDSQFHAGIQDWIFFQEAICQLRRPACLVVEF